MSESIPEILRQSFASDLQDLSSWRPWLGPAGGHRLWLQNASRPLVLKQYSHASAYQKERHALQHLLAKMTGCPRWVNGHDKKPWAILMSRCPGQSARAYFSSSIHSENKKNPSVGDLRTRGPGVAFRKFPEPATPNHANTPDPNHRSMSTAVSIASSCDTSHHSPQIDIFRAAGDWLKQLHEIKVSDRDPLPPQAALEQRKSRALAAATTLGLSQKLCKWLRSAELGSFASPRVICHRDYSPRNWLWDDRSHGFFVVDFEHTRLDLPVWDLLRLSEQPEWQEPHIVNAFICGYPKAKEWLADPAWPALCCIHAINTLAWARRHNDSSFVSNARANLKQFEANLGTPG